MEETEQRQFGGEIRSPLQIRQLFEEVSQVAQLLSQLIQFSEEISSKKELGHTQEGGVILSPLHIRQLLEEVSQFSHLFSQF
jgi:hypothetical protein